MVYITNITTNVSVGISGMTLKPGQGREFDDSVAEVHGVAAAERKGLISIEMVKSVPGGVAMPVEKEDKEPVKSDSESSIESEAEDLPDTGTDIEPEVGHDDTLAVDNKSEPEAIQKDAKKAKKDKRGRKSK